MNMAKNAMAGSSITAWNTMPRQSRGRLGRICVACMWTIPRAHRDRRPPVDSEAGDGRTPSPACVAKATSRVIPGVATRGSPARRGLPGGRPHDLLGQLLELGQRLPDVGTRQEELQDGVVKRRR